MESKFINRTADLLGEILYRAREGSPLWLGVAEKLLQEEGHPPGAQALVAAAELLAAQWNERLSGKAGAGGLETVLHPTESGRLLPTDFPPSPGGEGTRRPSLDTEGVRRHAARQISYGTLKLPAAPDVTRILADVGLQQQ